MQRFILTLATATSFLFAAGYTTGAFTPEVRVEESCPLCRAVRYSGTHYGFPFSHVETNPMTEWYARTIDTMHGADQMHPHLWQKSTFTEKSRTTEGFDVDCDSQTPPIFLMRPEVERAVLELVHDRDTEIALIRSMTDADRPTCLRRV